MQAVTTWRPRFVQELQGLRTTMWGGSFEENLCKWPLKGLSDEMRLVKDLGSRLVSSSSSGRAEERRRDKKLILTPASPAAPSHPTSGRPEGLVEARLGPNMSLWGSQTG